MTVGNAGNAASRSMGSIAIPQRASAPSPVTERREECLHCHPAPLLVVDFVVAMVVAVAMAVTSMAA